MLPSPPAPGHPAMAPIFSLRGMVGKMALHLTGNPMEYMKEREQRGGKNPVSPLRFVVVIGVYLVSLGSHRPPQTPTFPHFTWVGVVGETPDPARVWETPGVARGWYLRQTPETPENPY